MEDELTSQNAMANQILKDCRTIIDIYRLLIQLLDVRYNRF